jgi:hypothetical protein
LALLIGTTQGGWDEKVNAGVSAFDRIRPKWLRVLGRRASGLGVNR